MKENYFPMVSTQANHLQYCLLASILNRHYLGCTCSSGNGIVTQCHWEWILYCYFYLFFYYKCLATFLMRPYVSEKTAILSSGGEQKELIYKMEKPKKTNATRRGRVISFCVLYLVLCCALVLRVIMNRASSMMEPYSWIINVLQSTSTTYTCSSSRV